MEAEHAEVEEENTVKQSTIKDAEYDTFCFESDHLSLKGNTDYLNLIYTMAILQSQRIKAINDIETLKSMKKVALDAPNIFVEKLQRKEDLGIPEPQKISEIPKVDWEKYASSLNFKIDKEQKSRTRAKVNENTQNSSSDIKNESSHVLVRGRQAKDENSSETFNRLWTAEEQKKLEELLEKYPPEETESRRWKKIAAGLGNRTSTQVASRVQKFFIKLAQAGLPIPGKEPNLNQISRRSASNGYHRLINTYRHHPSIFFASFEPPVLMPADDEIESQQIHANSSFNQYDTMMEGSLDFKIDEKNIPPELKDTPEFKELMELKTTKSEIIEKRGAHYGYKCDNCGEEPIVGKRFHCTHCLHSSVDYCNQCYSRIQENNLHDGRHNFDAIDCRQASQFIDSDYQNFSFSASNYLDPNFIAKT